MRDGEGKTASHIANRICHLGRVLHAEIKLLTVDTDADDNDDTDDNEEEDDDEHDAD